MMVLRITVGRGVCPLEQNPLAAPPLGLHFALVCVLTATTPLSSPLMVHCGNALSTIRLLSATRCSSTTAPQVEDVDGLLLTAFSSSRSALAWALEVQEEARRLNW